MSKTGSGAAYNSTDLMSLIQEAGFRGSAAQTMYAIVMAESGGRANAYNGNAGTGDDSYGLAQINMIGSMGPSRRAEFGLSSDSDLFDPLTNLKAAYAISDHGTNFTPWSTYKSGAYQQFLGQSGASVTNGPAPSTADAYSTQASAARMTAESYAGVDSLGRLLSTIPALKKLVQEAVAGNWTAAKFQNEVENSAWYRTNSDTARSILIQQANDPAAYSQRLTTTEQSVETLMHQLGQPVSFGAVKSIAAEALLTGNDSNQQWLTKTLASHWNYQGIKSVAGMQGQMAQNVQQLQSDASNYGFTFTPVELATYAQRMLTGEQTEDTYKQQLINWAKSAFPALSKQLDEGQTVKDLAAPYVQSMSNLLEVDPSTLSTYTPLIRKALQGVTDPTTKQREAVPVWQFEDQVRQDPRWQYTQNARDTVSTALLKVGADWGFGPNG